MNRIFKIALLGLFSAFSLISCHKDDPIADVPPIPFAEQYPVDLANIDKFLDEYHMDVSVNDDVTFTKIPTPNPTNLTSIRAEFITPYPIADRTKMVSSGGVDYKIYYIPFHEGLGERPSRVDSVLVAYKGEYIYKKTDATTTPSTTYIASNPFDQAQNPAWFPLTSVVAGWREIIPLFKAANTHTQNSDGTTTYGGYGAGVMFLPSAFGYYSNGAGTIPSYAPLIFSIKLMGLNYVDNDFDRIDSKDEDINGNGLLSDDDTDGDGKPNYLDQDDDGDGYFTKFEISYTNPSSLIHYYPYNGAAVDDLATPYVDESHGVPACGNVDFTSPTRVRKYLDKNCH